MIAEIHWGLYTLITDNRLTMKAFKSNADFSSFHHNEIECVLTDIPCNISSFAHTFKGKVALFITTTYT